jgi:hypothetical protein
MHATLNMDLIMSLLKSKMTHICFLLSFQTQNPNLNDIIFKIIDALKSLTKKKPKKSPTYVVKKFQNVWLIKCHGLKLVIMQMEIY